DSLVDRHAGRRHDADRVADVFDRNRNAVQRSQIGACSDFSFRTAGLRRRKLGRHGCVDRVAQANGTAAEDQDGVPPLPLPARGSGDLSNQPGVTWMGELLRGWKLWRVLLLHQGLGREESPAPYDAFSETTGLRLDAVE